MPHGFMENPQMKGTFVSESGVNHEPMEFNTQIV